MLSTLGGLHGGVPVRRQWADWKTALKRMEPQPQFLTISWESNDWEGTEVTMQAVLCLRHRKEIGLEATQAAHDTPVQSPTASNQPVNNAA